MHHHNCTEPFFIDVAYSQVIPTFASSEVLPYEVFTGAAESSLDLTQGPHLVPLAARSMTRIHVQLEASQQTAIVEEGVNVNIDCLPWQSQISGGDTQWLFAQRTLNSDRLIRKSCLTNNNYHSLLKQLTIPSSLT